MKLVFTPNPEYIHQVLVVAHEAGITDRLTFERTRPFGEPQTIWNYNPFGKVPALVMDNGDPLYGGLVICEYFDSLSTTGKSVYPKGDKRWPALRQMMTGDGMFDAVTLLRVEGWRDKAVWNMEYMIRERKKIIAALDRLELETPQFRDEPFHIGHICIVGALSYLDLRNPIREYAIVDGDANWDWRPGRKHLETWYDGIKNRPSFLWKVQLPE